MIQKFRQWLVQRFLPAWARAELTEEIRQLRQEKERLERKIGILNAYIDGLETGIRNQRKIIIRNGEGKA